MSANLQLYKQEVIHFLQSCTIVFSPMAAQINANLQARGIAVDFSRPETFKYYQNLSGQYHATDTVMTIQSLDTKATVDFTVAMLAAHPKTKAAYVIGSPYHAALCTAYPRQIDLIKSIIYPVDLSAALAAPDFTLLGWGKGFLEATEQDVIIEDLKRAITYIADRWYFAFLGYETYYTWAFWAVFWQSLPNIVFAARLKHLHTAAAHSFHIWSYLQSHGIGDYSDVLTSQQALFLYRNLRYLEQNQGKHSNLVILVNHLLDTINVGLVGKTIYMNTDRKAASCEWTPEFVSTVIPTNNAQSLQLVAPATMTTLNDEMITARLEVNNEPEYVAAQETRIGRTPHNTLPTKLVEIQQIGVDHKYGGLLNNFILDTLVWGITSGYYAPDITVTDPTTKQTFALTGKDALALYYYAVHRGCREHPAVLPTTYAPTCAFRPNITAASIPSVFTYDGKKYATKAHLAIDVLDGVGYPPGTIALPDYFSEIIADLFLVLIRYVRYSRVEGSKIAVEMLLSYCETALLQTQVYTFALSPTADYPTWLVQRGLAGMIGKLDAHTGYVDAYNALSTAIMTALLPQNSPVYRFFGYTSPSTNNLYDRLRNLFVELCSYNIAFLDTSRTSAWWVFTEKIVYTIAGMVSSGDHNLTIDPILPPGTLGQHDHIHIPLGTTCLQVAVGIHTRKPFITRKTNTLRVVKAEIRPVEQPLALTVRRPIARDSRATTVIAPLQVAMFTTSTSAMTGPAA